MQHTCHGIGARLTTGSSPPGKQNLTLVKRNLTLVKACSVQPEPSSHQAQAEFGNEDRRTREFHLQQVHAAVALRPAAVWRRHLHHGGGQPSRIHQKTFPPPLQQRQPVPPRRLNCLQRRPASTRSTFRKCQCPTQ